MFPRRFHALCRHLAVPSHSRSCSEVDHHARARAGSSTARAPALVDAGPLVGRVASQQPPSPWAAAHFCLGFSSVFLIWLTSWASTALLVRPRSRERTADRRQWSQRCARAVNRTPADSAAGRTNVVALLSFPPLGSALLASMPTRPEGQGN